jgi:hypothetical protein
MNCALFSEAPAFLANIRPGWTGMPWTNSLAYLALLSVMKKNDFKIVKNLFSE